MNRLLIISGMLSLASCSATQFLNENQKFYSGEEFKYINDTVGANKEALSLEMGKIIEPDPNTKLLGSRPGVWFHYKLDSLKKKKGFKAWMKRNLAKAPVFAGDIKQESMQGRLEEFLSNEGYFRNEVTTKLVQKKHTAYGEYTVNTGPVYTIRKIDFPRTTGVYDPLLEDIISQSLLKEGARYRLENLQNEQKRIEDYLEDRGFYYFDDNYLIYLADSSAGNYQVDLTLTLSEDTPDQAKRQFRYDEVLIRPDYSIAEDSISKSDNREELNGYTFINNDDYIRPDILTKTVVFKKGDLYSEQAEIKTRERLMSLGTYKFVNLKFNQVDSASLRSEIALTPLPKKSLRLDLQAISNSNNFVGPSITAAFQNRNAFRGAELFELKLNAAYEVQISGQNNPPLNAYELNLESSITVPRLITPFNINYQSLRFIPQTRFSLGLRQQQRLNVFRINSFEGQYGFIWQETYTKQHKFYPVNISLLQLGQISDDFRDRLENDPNLSRSLEDQFILGAQYEYTFSSKNAKKNTDRRHNFYFNGLIDISGNIANGVISLLNVEQAEEDQITFSQYAKLQLDFRHFKKIGAKNEFASKLLIGGARAYGNSEDVPFIKQFSSGGSNSLRAFRARSVGPGAYLNDESGDLVIDETGDIKIETSLEYRAHLGGVFEGALFVDAGNVWLWEPRPELKPEGEFNQEFYRDLIVGTGAGLRLDFNFFLLRFDLAFPIRMARQGGVDWVFKDINPLDRDWRRNNLILNIAIGYPF